MFRPALFLAVSFLIATSIGDEVRTWTDSTGKHTKKGEFVELDDETVILKGENGKRIRIPLKKLSKSDQSLAKQLAAPETEPTAKEQPTKKPSRDFATKRKSQPAQMINMVRAAPYRVESMNNLKQMAIAIQQYELTNQQFPTVGMKTSTGNPGLSWRVAILPYLEEGNLFKQFRQNEPWDSPHNKSLIERMPKMYKSPGGSDEPGVTNYLAIASDDSIIKNAARGSRSNEVRDGMSKTLLIVEADDSEAVIWTKPDDYEWTYEDPSAGLGHIWPAGQFLGVMADGSVQRLYASVGTEQLVAMFTKAARD